MPTYRSVIAVNNVNQRDIAYARLGDLFRHAGQEALNLTITRVQRMPDNFVEVDTNQVISAAQLAHLGLQ